MADTLRKLIDRLRQEAIIQSNPEFDSTLAMIGNYADNNFKKAYLLGYFFKYKLDSDNLPVELKNYLIYMIKQNHLEDYYYLKKKPVLKQRELFPFFTLMMGLSAILAGFAWAKGGIFGFDFNPRYLSSIFKSGGYYLLLGLLLIGGSIISIRSSYRKNSFLRNISMEINCA